jgi:hypothetical protein
VIAEVSRTEWLIGWIVGVGVVLVVAAMVLLIIFLAWKIKGQLLGIHAALTDARDNTAALWEVQATNQVAEDILGAAQTARSVLGG